MIKTLQPAPKLLDMVTAMFKSALEASRAPANQIIASSKREITRLDKEIDAVLDRIMSANYETLIRRFEEKIVDLEKKKALMLEHLGKQAKPQGAFDKKPELAQRFL